MGNDRNLRNVLLVFLKRFGRTRSNLMAARMVIRAISNMPPGQRAALTSKQIEAELKSGEQQLLAQPDPVQVEIETTLAGEGPFENELAKFVANLQW
jgi:hypothetical protein